MPTARHSVTLGHITHISDFVFDITPSRCERNRVNNNKYNTYFIAWHLIRLTIYQTNHYTIELDMFFIGVAMVVIVL
jgi:hypothetical protein